MTTLVVSVACSYYSFAFDEILVLPALMAAFAKGNRVILLAGFLVTNLGYAIYISSIARQWVHGPMFLFWTATAWLLTFLLSRRFAHGFTRSAPVNEHCAAPGQICQR